MKFQDIRWIVFLLLALQLTWVIMITTWKQIIMGCDVDNIDMEINPGVAHWICKETPTSPINQAVVHMANSYEARIDMLLRDMLS